MVEALGHNVPRVFMLVFGGGSALAGLAGVIGGNAFVTEPAMARDGRADHLRGGGGRRHGLARRRLRRVAADRHHPDLRGRARLFARRPRSRRSASPSTGPSPSTTSGALKIAQVAPILPYLLLVLILIFRPKGLLGTRET